MRKGLMVGAVLFLLLAACGGNSGATTTTPGASGPQIIIEGRSFSGVSEVAAGTDVQIVNRDAVRHSVTSKETGLFDVVVDGGTTGDLTFDSPGEFEFFCRFHLGMEGKIVVT